MKVVSAIKIEKLDGQENFRVSRQLRYYVRAALFAHFRIILDVELV